MLKVQCIKDDNGCKVGHVYEVTNETAIRYDIYFADENTLHPVLKRNFVVVAAP